MAGPVILNCVQGSPEWHEARLGIVTASEIQAVMSDYGDVYKAGPQKGQPKPQPARQTYMDKLIGERLRGEVSNTFTGNAATMRGHADEIEALALYQKLRGGEVSNVGLIINHNVGYSPDALVWMVDSDGLAEVKSKEPHLFIPVLLDEDGVPAEHYAQCQCGLWVAEREWIDFVCYCRGMPLLVRRCYRDEAYIATMARAIEEFYQDLEIRFQRVLEAA